MTGMSDRSSTAADGARSAVLDRVARYDLYVVVAIATAALIELALGVVAFSAFDRADRTHRLVFFLFLLGYLVNVLGMMALGAHISRSVTRVVAALEGSHAG